VRDESGPRVKGGVGRRISPIEEAGWKAVVHRVSLPRAPGSVSDS
jgi:hypothetical protein